MDKWKDDIERYLSGKMTPAERHALEKKALNDPFLADALEGAESVTPENFSLDVEELNKKITSVQSKPNWTLRIAASVVGLAIVSTAIIYSLRNDNVQLANETMKKDTLQSAAAKADTLLIAAKEEKKKDEAASGEIIRKEEAKPKTDGSIALKSKDKKQQLAVKPDLASTSSTAGASGAGPTELKPTKGLEVQNTFTIADSTVIAELDDAKEITAAPVVQQQPKLAEAENKVQSGGAGSANRSSTENLAAKDASSRKRSKSKTATASADIQNQNLIVNGIVRDQQGQPLPGVNVIVKDLNTGTVTNAEGKYSLNLQSSNSTLVYSFIGFVPQEVQVDKSSAYADVQLMEDATQLSEVVVTGYGEKKDSDEPVVRLAEPVGGRKAYDLYLDEKKIYPQLAIDNKVEGKVIVEFTVSEVGEISDFKMIKKLGFGCDEEVIRLVKEGPRWNPSYIDNEAVESLVRIKTRFELPEKK